MINRTITVPLIWATLLLSVCSGSLFAQGKSADSRNRSYGNDRSKPVTDLTPWQQPTEPEGSHAKGKSADSHGRSYGIGQPKTIDDLPPGQLRKALEGLPGRAKGKALGWLQEFSFPAEDVKSLRVNSEGAIYYAEPIVSDTLNLEPIEATATNAAMDESQVFKLHSRPGSTNVVYLDFDGHTIEATSGWSYKQLVALPFDPSQNDNPATVANFTQDELNRIVEIWHRISEDYASFDIDVTTEEPVEFTPTTGRLLFTHDTDANGNAMPQQGVGGVAFTNTFGHDNFVSTYSPTLVYYTNLSTDNFGMATLNAEAASHEFGHNLGLSHDGTSSGLSYYEGHGNGLVSWAPIMGRPFYANITNWSQGEYPDANNTQDDLGLIAGKIGWIGDDHGDSAASATPLLVEPNGNILVSSPELDPSNILPENKGIINDRADVDWFYFDVTESGPLEITATPAWHSFTRNENRGANLDIELALFDASLALLAVDEPDDDTNATVTVTATPGRYYLQVHGAGNDTNSDYSDYASMGMYFLEGNITVGAIDNTPPSPASMSWQTAPHASGENTFSMTAFQASDDSGSVEYYFSCVAGGNGCTDSGWQTGRSWSPSGLDADTYYSYNVIARDTFGNENIVSATVGDTTDAPATPPPSADNNSPVAVASYNPAPAVISKGKTASITLSASGSTDSDGVIFEWVWKNSDGTIISTDMAFGTKLKAGTHNFTLTVTDNDGASDSTNLLVSVTKAGDDGGGGGGGKPCNPRKEACG